MAFSSGGAVKNCTCMVALSGLLSRRFDDYEICPKIPALVLNWQGISIHVPLHEWAQRGDMTEAERLIALGCLDGSLAASEQ